MRRELLRIHLRDARERVRRTAWSAAQAAMAATAAWWLAHDALGHPHPFFAPIAAAVAVSTSRIQRARRSIQLVVGVLLGIAIAEVLHSVLGDSALALGVIVFVTFVVALAVGAGFIGQGMMFANQAAASAILVVTLHRQGTGAERAVDALIGGACAVVIGTLLFPADPLKMIYAAENDMLRALARAVREVLADVRRKQRPSAEWTLDQTARIHAGVAQLDNARSTARAITRVAPRRWSMREEVAAEDARVAQIDLLANAVLTLIRTAGAAAAADDLPAQLDPQLERLWELLAQLATEPRPWHASVVNEAEALTRSILEDTAAGRRYPVITRALETTARDLLRVVE